MPSTSFRPTVKKGGRREDEDYSGHPNNRSTQNTDSRKNSETPCQLARVYFRRPAVGAVHKTQNADYAHTSTSPVHESQGSSLHHPVVYRTGRRCAWFCLSCLCVCVPPSAGITTA
ncbi:unnamed protein product [Ectocarpus fasciculatus]